MKASSLWLPNSLTAWNVKPERSISMSSIKYLVGILVLLLCIWNFRTLEAAPSSRTIVLKGSNFSDRLKDLSLKVDLPEKGVWYIWLKVKKMSRGSLSYTVDGKGYLKAPRNEIQIGEDDTWVTTARDHNFRIEIYVETKGTHELNLKLIDGNFEIEKIYLSQFFSSAAFDGDLHDGADPALLVPDVSGSGRIFDGFREKWASPAVKASRTKYFLDSKGGDDLNSGLSPSDAWKTFQNANKVELFAGDAILLKRGSEWTGSLKPKGSGIQSRWNTIGAYGSGARPKIDGGQENAISILDGQYWVVQDLQVTNDIQSKMDGISVMSSKGTPRKNGIKILNCVAYDTGRSGINVGSEYQNDDAQGFGRGYDDIHIENCLAFYNTDTGIRVGGASGNTSDGVQNFVIKNCTAFSNVGEKGGGIYVLSGRNGLIENCVAFNNSCVNVWVWNASNVTVRSCEAFRGRPPADALGFDLDYRSNGCTIEYCYAHENQGEGYLLMGNGDKLGDYPDQSSLFNILRYCVSASNGKGEVVLSATLKDSKIYNNTFIGNADSILKLAGWPSYGGWGGGWPSNLEIFNNKIISMGEAPLIHVDDYATSQNNFFDFNQYVTLSKDKPLIKWGGRVHGADFWQGKGAEGNIPPALFADLGKFRSETSNEKNGVEQTSDSQSFDFRPLKLMPLVSNGRVPQNKNVKGRPPVFSEEWIKKRGTYLFDTKSEMFGISRVPFGTSADYLGTKIVEGQSFVGAVR